jgi:hypothetical protein
MWASSLQIKALADCNLLFPSLLKQRAGESESPTRALVATIIFGFCCMLIIWIVFQFGLVHEFGARVLSDIQFITLLLVYTGVLVAYCYFRVWGYGACAETYKSPAGVPGAVCGSVIFLGMLASLPFQKRGHVAEWSENMELASCITGFACVAVYLVAMTVYYFVVAKKAQTMTRAEETTYLSVYAVRSKYKRKEKHCT